MTGLPLELDGHPLVLDPTGAVQADDAVFVADLHLGKTVALRQGGCPVPEGPSDETLARLTRLLGRTRASRLVVLGDLWHDATGTRDLTASALERWRAEHPDLEWWLIPGNHDRQYRDLANALRVRVVTPGTSWRTLALRHEPRDSREPELAGHLHPVASVPGRPKCFWLRGASLVLPAFGAFTGGWTVDPGADDRLFVCTEDRVIELPPGLRRSRRRLR